MWKISLRDSTNRLIAYISFERAQSLIVRKKVQVMCVMYNIRYNHCIVDFPIDLKLLRTVDYDVKKVIPCFSKYKMFMRDGFRCCYCGKKSFRKKRPALLGCTVTTLPLTVDHVIPEVQRGETSFDNCVTACFECNNRKHGRTPEEANMILLRKPYTPTKFELMHMICTNIIWQ